MASVFQDLEAAAESIDAKVPALSGGRTPVVLPSGFATEAKQTSLETDVEQLHTDNLAGVRGIRRDADTSPVNDGETHVLTTNQYGRLKVSTQPAAINATTGDITAVQATAGTPVAGGTVQADVARASNVMMYCTGTFSLINCVFEGSIDSGTTWFSIQAVRTNANTIETSTGNLSAAPAYAWELSVNAMTHVRVRCTLRTSGTQTWRILPGVYATEPIPAVQAHAITGTVGVSGAVTATPANVTPSNVTLAASNNLTSLKASAGNLYAVSVSNNSGATVYLKWYSKASAPVVASDVPIMTIPVPVGFTVLDWGPLGHRFALGIAYAVTGAATDTDATNIALGVKLAISYI